MDGYLARHRHRGRALVPPQSDVSGLVDSPWEAQPTLRSGWEVGRAEGGEGMGTGGGVESEKRLFF